MINNYRRMAIVTAIGALGAMPVRREPTDEERAQMDAKAAAQNEEAARARREYWASIEASNAAKVDSAVNRRTGKPHEHNRAKTRRLRQIGATG